MTRQFDQFAEDRQAKANMRLVAAIEFDLSKAVARAGGDLLGYSIRCGQGEGLVTLRAVLAGKAQVAFVGAETPADAIRKAVRDGYADKLTWRQDKYGT